MSKPVEILAFAVLALGAHLGAWVWVAEPGASSAGDEGEASVSLAAATGEIADLVETWTVPPDVQTSTPEALPELKITDAALPSLTPVALPQKAPRPDPARATAADPLPAALPEALPQPPRPQAPVLTAPPLPDDDAVALPDPAPPRLDHPRQTVLDPPEPDAAPAPDATPRTLPPRPRARPDQPVETARDKPADRPEPAPAKKTSAATPAQKAAGNKQGRNAGQSKANGESTLSKAARASLMANWGASIRNGVERRKRYPRSTTAAGKTVLRLTVSRSGSLVSVQMVKSSGDAALDKAALSAVRRARFPAAPKGLGEAQYQFNLPLAFSVR